MPPIKTAAHPDCTAPRIALAQSSAFVFKYNFVIQRALAAHDFIKLSRFTHPPQRSCRPRVNFKIRNFAPSTRRIPPKMYLFENALAFGAARRTVDRLNRPAPLRLALHFPQCVIGLLLRLIIRARYDLAQQPIEMTALRSRTAPRQQHQRPMLRHDRLCR